MVYRLMLSQRVEKLDLQVRVGKDFKLVPPQNKLMFSKIGSIISWVYFIQLSVYSLTSWYFFFNWDTRRPKPQVRNEINQCTGCTVVTRYLTRNPRSKSRKELIMNYLSLSRAFIDKSNDCKSIFTTAFAIEFITYSNGHLIPRRLERITKYK